MGTIRGIDTEDQLKTWLPNAQIGQRSEPAKEEEPREMVTPGAALVAGRLVIFVAVETKSELNGYKWKAFNRRNGAAWKDVSRTLGPHLALLAPFAEAYHAQQALRVKFVRLGGRMMDRSNLPTATKAVEDALAFMIGANDGDPRWCSSFEQEIGGAAGVRIELEARA